MLVSELIKKLQEYPQDIFVLSSGYENGYNGLDPEDMGVRTLVKCETPWYNGMYQPIHDGEPDIGKAISEPKEYLCLQ